MDDTYEVWCQDCQVERSCDEGISRSGLREWAVDHVQQTGHAVRFLHQQVREFTPENVAGLAIVRTRSRRSKVHADVSSSA